MNKAWSDINSKPLQQFAEKYSGIDLLIPERFEEMFSDFMKLSERDRFSFMLFQILKRPLNFSNSNALLAELTK